MSRKAGGGLPETVGGTVVLPGLEFAAPATAAPPTAAPLTAATPSPTFLILLSMVAPFVRPGSSRVREPRCSRLVGAPFGVARKVLRHGIRGVLSGSSQRAVRRF